MLTNITVELPDKMKRGFISHCDRKMVTMDVNGNNYQVSCTNNTFSRGYEANYFHQSNIFTRIMARLIEGNWIDRDIMASGGYGAIHARLMAGDDQAWREMVAHTPRVKRYEKLVVKVYKFIVSTDDCFNLMPMFLSYWTVVLEKPEVLLHSYIHGNKYLNDTNAYALGNLFDTTAFQALSDADQSQWKQYLTAYVADVDVKEHLLAIRDHAVELGDDYKFLTEACKELLL